MSDSNSEDMDEKIRMKWKENRNVMFVFAIVGSVVTLATPIMVFRLKTFYNDEVCFTDECAESSLFLLDFIDTTKDPCDNFYHFACAHHVPKATMDYAQKIINTKIRRLTTGHGNPGDSVAVRLQKKFYRACRDVEAIENDNNDSLRKTFARLGGWPFLNENWNASVFDWEEMMIKCKEIGLKYDWFFVIEMTEAIDNRIMVRPPLVDKIDFLKMANILKILGATVTISDIATKIQRVAKFADDLYQIVEGCNNTAVREYRFVEFRHKFYGIDWSKLLAKANLTDASKIISEIDDCLPKIERLIAQTPKRVQADYIFWIMTKSLYQFLSLEVRKEFEIFEHLGGIKNFVERPELCYRMTRAVFPYISEAAYARKLTKERQLAKDIIQRVRALFMGHIDNAAWINETSKHIAKEIASNITIFVGAPEEMYNEKSFERLVGWNDISILNLTNPLDILMEINKRKYIYSQKTKSTILENNKMFYANITDITATKYLIHNNQHIVIVPAAALDGLLFSKERSNFLNYGLLGALIARTFTRSVTKYKSSNVSECIFQECGKDEMIISNSTFECDNEIDEYFVDYMGANLAYEAYTYREHHEDRLPGISYHSRQLFWISHAATMCNNFDNDKTDRMRGSRQVSISRVLSALRNSKYFAEDFNCDAESEMNPGTKCHI